MSRRRTLLVSSQMLVLIFVWHLVAVRLQRPFLPVPLLVFGTFFAEILGEDTVTGLLTASSWQDVAAALAQPNGRLLADTWASLKRIGVSLFWGTLVAAPLAIATADNRWLDRLLSPLLYVLYPAPKIVFLPIVIFFFGLGDPSIVFLISVIVFFQIYVIVRDSAAQVPPQTLDSLEALGANRWQRLLHVYVPLGVPAVITALKISIGTAIAVLFIAESLGNTDGLGYYINSLQLNRFAYNKVYAGIVAVSLLGSLLFGLLSWLEWRSSRWQR
jgi:NitT/TauT family transport system permease protein